MKIVLTYTNKWDFYDLVGLAFALIMSMWIGNLLGWGFWGVTLSAFVLGMFGPHLAAFLRHPPPKENPNSKNSD